jgi:8-oxo-dGTP pyrophosphatase MutT (NUDIX family)
VDKNKFIEVIQSQNRDLSSIKVPLTRIKVRAIVKCGDDYLFIKRTRPGKAKHYTVFAGGRAKKTDRLDKEDKFDRHDLKEVLEKALLRELKEELACQLIKIGEILSISKVKVHDQEVLYYVEVGSYDWGSRTGKEFFNPNKGTYELIVLKSDQITEEKLGKKDLRFKPKPWKKLLIDLFKP